VTSGLPVNVWVPSDMTPSIRVAGLAALLVVASGCGGGSGERDSASSVAGSPSSAVTVPDVVDLSEGAAVKALGEAGLVANVRFVKDAPPTGKVLASKPAAGSELQPEAVVVITVAPMPRRPVPGPDEEQELQPFNSMIEANPEAFVGLYLDEDGVPHAVFGPGVDPADWRERLTAAAEGLPYRTDVCSRSHAELRRLQDEIEAKSWTTNKKVPFGVLVHPATCTVRVESDLLTAADIRALVDRYGTTVSIDTTEGLHPVPLGPED
jgi:PASTA domain